MYETELMREILKSPMAQKMIQEISPRYGSAYVFLWLMQVTGAEWDEMSRWAEEYQLQVVPQTATWALEYWERQYGIDPNPDLTDDQRRQAIIAARSSKGPMNPARLERIASAAVGAPAKIEENTSVNRFALHITAPPWSVDEEAVKAAIKPAKPARLRYDILYEGAVSGEVYVAGTAFQQLKVITLAQAE